MPTPTGDFPTPSPDPSRTPGQGLTKEQALKRILEGHWRYLEGQTTKTEITQKERIQHVEGQYPFAAILGCADSRVSPELIFDQAQGDLFVVRVAGNILGSGSVASLEYAVKHLGVRLILILGHEHCGAVKAATTTTGASGAMGFLLSELKPAVEAAKDVPGDWVDNAVYAHVRLTVQALAARSEIIAEALGAGDLRIIGGVYRLGSGDVEILPGLG